MSEKTRYSASELEEFEELINQKLEKARRELKFAKDAISKKDSSDIEETAPTSKVLEDGALTLEKQRLIKLAERQAKFVSNLENALLRIKNGTYGVCVDTGNLIPKERLRAVPHTQHSIEAKLNRA